MYRACPHVQRLIAEHTQLAQMGQALIALLDRPEPPSAEILSEHRWNIARTVLRHLPTEERYVYRRLDEHRRPEAIRIAQRFRDDLANTYEPFKAHSERWTIDAALADWTTYRVATRRLILMLDDRMQREEAELYPQLVDAPHFVPERSADTPNFAGDAWAIRASLGR